MMNSFVRFSGDRKGNIAPLFALILTPVMFVVGVSIDYHRATATRDVMQSAVDAAALAVAKKIALHSTSPTDSGEALLAVNTATLSSDVHTTHSITTTSTSVTVTEQATVPTTFMALVTPSLTVSAEAVAAVPSIGAPLCILGLNANAPDTVNTWGSAVLQAPGCAVHSNSMSATGLDNGGSATATAAFFCTAANAYGGSAYAPNPSVNCGQEADPYANKYTQPVLANSGINVYGTCNQTKAIKVSSTATYDAGGPTNVYLFCGGLTVNAGASVTFKPGVYVFFNEFLVSSNATVNAPAGVTFFLGDGGNGVKNGYLTIQGGGNITLAAPTTGPLAGMAIVQPVVMGYIGGSTPAITNTITGSGKLNITGVIYTPQAKLLITGNGNVNTGTAYFGMVADFIALQGNGSLNIAANADAQAASMPAMKTVSSPAQQAALTH